jgi:hypothetical protein
MESLNFDFLQAMDDDQDSVMADTKATTSTSTAPMTRGRGRQQSQGNIRSLRTPSPEPVIGKKHSLSPSSQPSNSHIDNYGGSSSINNYVTPRKDGNRNILMSPSKSATTKRRMSSHDRYTLNIYITETINIYIQSDVST